MLFYQDKDSKINFLQKAIDAVVMVTGEPLSVKPARVVAGHEPEKTNEFLQAIGKCCLNKVGQNYTDFMHSGNRDCREENSLTSSGWTPAGLSPWKGWSGTARNCPGKSGVLIPVGVQRTTVCGTQCSGMGTRWRLGTSWA